MAILNFGAYKMILFLIGLVVGANIGVIFLSVLFYVKR